MAASSWGTRVKRGRVGFPTTPAGCSRHRTAASKARLRVAAAEEPGVGYVLHAPQRPPECGGVVAAFRDGGLHSSALHARPGGIVPVDVPGDLMHGDRFAGGQDPPSPSSRPKSRTPIMTATAAVTWPVDWYCSVVTS
jgi:hypothetical protein